VSPYWILLSLFFLALGIISALKGKYILAAIGIVVPFLGLAHRCRSACQTSLAVGDVVLRRREDATCGESIRAGGETRTRSAAAGTSG
jgi:hypothetical protein